MAGNPRNHSALLSAAQVDTLRSDDGADAGDRVGPVRRVDARGHRVQPAPGRASAASRVSRRWRSRCRRDRRPHQQAGLDAGGLRPRARRPLAQRRRRAIPRHDRTRRRHLDQPGRVHQPRRRLRADAAPFVERGPAAEVGRGPVGQHIELGISEMNLFLLLGQLGLSWDISGQPLMPVGTVYDPFVCRGLDALIYSVYSGSRFVVAGTPSGVTLAPEGGAHQSTITASIGLELPGLTAVEPAYATALDWLLCDAWAGSPRVRPRRRRQCPRTPAPTTSGSRPVRSTRRRSRRLGRRIGDAVLRRQVLAGAYQLVDGRAGLAEETRPRRRPCTWSARARCCPRSAGGGGAGRGGDRRARRRPDLRGPAVRRLAADPASGHPHRDDTVRPRCAPRRLPRAGADRHRPRRGVARAGVARARRSSSGCVPIGVDEFGQSGADRRPVRAARPDAGVDRQRRPRRTVPAIGG